MREVVIGKNDAGQRLDKFLTKSLKNFPQSLLYKSIRLKKIKVNRHRAEASQILVEGDVLQLFLAEEFFEGRDARTEHALASIKGVPDILYEDAHIMLINKRAGIAVHEGEGNGETLIDEIQAYLYRRGEYDPAREQSFAPALCNRIDRNTAGIVIAAKTAEALRDMDKAIRDHRVHKKYLAITHGTPTPREATLRGYLLKNEKTKQVSVFDTNPPRGAKEIITRYRVMETRGDLALVEVTLLTGRTHQIRAHLAHVGHPLLGDGKYGVNRADRARGYTYQALCSYQLSFDFKGQNSCLSYLDGKCFEIPKEDIYFVKELFM